MLQGGQLAEILTADEQGVMSQMMKNNSWKRMWLSARQEEVGWVWQDGTLLGESEHTRDPRVREHQNNSNK